MTIILVAIAVYGALALLAYAIFSTYGRTILGFTCAAAVIAGCIFIPWIMMAGLFALFAYDFWRKDVKPRIDTIDHMQRYLSRRERP